MQNGRILACRERNDVVTSAADLETVRTFAAQRLPDLIILEFSFTAQVFEHQLGFPVYQQLRAIESLKRVPVLLWMVPNPKRVKPEAQRLGMAGYVAMPSGTQELLKARDVILAGGTYYPE
jgi:DNA-binding NarL/FixJ family response regulator